MRSYGIYLWMFPIIVLTTPTVTSGVEPLRAALQVAASIGVAALSWKFIEEPIRHGALGRLWARIREGTWKPKALPQNVRVAVGVGLATLLLACVGLAGAAPPTHFGFLTAQDSNADAQAALSGGTISHTSTAATTPAGTAPKHGTSCTSVVHIGDSTSEGLVSTNYLPKRSERIEARYADQGVRRERMEISGATSIVETLPGGTNAQDVAHGLIDSGYDGCWVLALGTNDAADVYVGSSVSLSTRIDKMMSVRRRPTGHVGEREVARRQRAICRDEHGAVEHGPRGRVRQVPEHAHLRLGRGGQGLLVHPGRDPLHLGRATRREPS